MKAGEKMLSVWERERKNAVYEGEKVGAQQKQQIIISLCMRKMQTEGESGLWKKCCLSVTTAQKQTMPVRKVFFQKKYEKSVVFEEEITNTAWDRK